MSEIMGYTVNKNKGQRCTQQKISPGTEFLLRVIEAISRIFSTRAPSRSWC